LGAKNRFLRAISGHKALIGLIGCTPVLEYPCFIGPHRSSDTRRIKPTLKKRADGRDSSHRRGRAVTFAEEKASRRHKERQTSQISSRPADVMVEYRPARVKKKASRDASITFAQEAAMKIEYPMQKFTLDAPMELRDELGRVHAPAVSFLAEAPPHVFGIEGAAFLCRLEDAGKTLVAVEPDDALAAHLARRMADPAAAMKKGLEIALNARAVFLPESNEWVSVAQPSRKRKEYL